MNGESHPEDMADEEQDWPSNYFNYFTEVEEHFTRARGTGLFLLSPLDWALIESWKNAGVPLEAILRGIDAAFDKWRSRKTRTQMVNSLAFCAQAVMSEAEEMAGTAEHRSKRQAASAPFPVEAMKSYLDRSLRTLGAARGFEEIAAGLERLLAEADVLYGDLEQMEQRLTALEDRMIAIARSRQTDEAIFRARRDLDQQLKPYRGKMTAPQVAMLEKQYLERRLLEDTGLPRLSLFYLSWRGAGSQPAAASQAALPGHAAPAAFPSPAVLEKRYRMGTTSHHRTSKPLIDCCENDPVCKRLRACP